MKILIRDKYEYEVIDLEIQFKVRAKSLNKDFDIGERVFIMTQDEFQKSIIREQYEPN